MPLDLLVFKRGSYDYHGPEAVGSEHWLYGWCLEDANGTRAYPTTTAGFVTNSGEAFGYAVPGDHSIYTMNGEVIGMLPGDPAPHPLAAAQPGPRMSPYL